MNIDIEIRKLARSDYWQTVYNATKDNSGIKLFQNSSDLSSPQVQFMQWLSIYNMLNMELAQKESNYLTAKAIQDDERTNAYLYYRKRKIEQEWFDHQKEKKVNEATSKHKFKNPESVQVIDVDLRRGTK